MTVFLAHIAGSFVEAADYLSSQGLEEESTDLEARADALIAQIIDNNTSHTITSHTGRTVTAKKRLTRQEMRRIRRKIKRHPPRRKRWKCCKKIERRKGRKGKHTWGAVCRYKLLSGKKAGQTAAMWIPLGSGPRRPRSVTIKGKRMPRCRKKRKKK